MDIKDVQKLISEKKDNVLIPMVQSMSENFAKCFETGVEVGIEIGKAISPDYSKVWHKPSEEPANGCKIIVVEKLADNSICHDIGYYNKARNIVACELSDVWFEHCARWAYIEDLVKATLTDF